MHCYLTCCNYLGFLVDSSVPVLNLARKKVDQLLLVGEDFCPHAGSLSLSQFPTHKPYQVQVAG